MTIHNKEEYLSVTRPVIDLTGPEGNSFMLLARAKAWCEELEIDFAPIRKDMMSGDYEHLLEVLERNFGEYVDFLQ